ncbi:hypothetical protein PENSOL_c040G02799 [Penicillium solitum]|uniref:Uncharacterized protein n=1 Tax=Penicillium solitum TaxID=60172 RepID=A0A1V6QUG5_9EURO|nr:uncharacterized protein PENSOL_c040G02799 [Penicillium solitum]OQD92592.1 hypothetical protein PENSOL_c040G02799 [Penicillium solitum]
MGGSLNATLSSSEPTLWVSLSHDCKAEMEKALSRCVSGPSVDYNSVVISLGGQISPMAMSKQHTERATSDGAITQQQGNCAQSQISISTESTVSATQSASSSYELPDKNKSSFGTISTSTGAPSETHGPTTAPAPKGFGELDLSICLIKEADYRASGLCHCASGSTRVFESAECTLVH